MTSNHLVVLTTPVGKATLALSRHGRTFRVESFKVEGREELCLAFALVAPGFENLDETSDASQCLMRSLRVKYGDVVLGAAEMRANSIEELEYVLKKAKVRPFNPEEI